MKKFACILLLLNLTLYSFGQSPGNALKFDGINDKVECPVPSVFNAIAFSDFTIEFWTKVQTFTFSRMIFIQDDIMNFVSVGSSSSNTIMFHVNANNVSYGHETGAVIPSGQWIHVAARWEASTQTASLLINGVVDTSTAANGTSAGIGSLMAIGNKAGASQYYNGEIDELRIWNVARTDCEIAANMNVELSGNETSLITYYNFNSGTPGGNNANDTLTTDLVSGATGTLYGFALTGASSNWISSGASITATGLQGDVNTAVNVNGGTLTASATGAGYQWVDCSNGNTIIPGATMQSFMPANDGQYAVIIDQNNCIDTSTCIFVTSIDDATENGIEYYPNPVKNKLYIKAGNPDRFLITITDLAGKIIEEIQYEHSNQIEIPFYEKPGVYIVTLKGNDINRSFKVLSF